MNLVSKYCLFSRLYTFAIFNEKKQSRVVSYNPIPVAAPKVFSILISYRSKMVA